ncbi:MAG: hypothetical protein JWP85_1613 [Rhodoglobus sp.]|nr:hypothetical protein [Rhodoglobus sp.]
MTDNPAPPPEPGTQPPAAAAVPPAAPRKPGSAATLFWRRPDAATLRGALIAVVIAWIIELIYQVLYIVEAISWSINDGPGGVPQAIGDFFFYGLLKALFFFGPVFIVLWQLLPIVKESPLPVILKRAAVSGVAGLAGLIVFGIGEAIADIVNYSFAFGYFVVSMLWFPLILALGFTVQLIVGSVVAWIVAARAPKVVAAAPAAPPAT